MITCKECGCEFVAPNALGYHLRSHGITYSDYVVKHEYAGVWPTCLNCQKPLVRKNGGFTTFCSKKCGSSGEHNGMYGLKGEQSPNFGQVRTPEQRENYKTGARTRWDIHGDMLREMMQTDEYKQAQRDAQISSYQTTDRAERIRESVHRFWAADTEETRQARKAAAERAFALLEQGKIGPQAPFKTEWVMNPFTDREEYMHSSWESAFFKKCINEGYPITKKHDLKIAYTGIDGQEHTYIPDFIALNENVVFEIKGAQRENDVFKLRALKRWAKKNGWRVEYIDYKPS